MTTRIRNTNTGRPGWQRLLQWLKAFDQALHATPSDSALHRLNGRISRLEATVRMEERS